jgi:two-component system, NtrC family, response regulator HupR/HoxA
VGRHGPLGGLLRDPEEVADAGKTGRASVQSTEAPHDEAPRIGLAVSAAPAVSPPRRGRWQALEFAEVGALALDEDRVGSQRTPLELVSSRRRAALERDVLGERSLTFPEGYIHGPSEAMQKLYAQMAPLVQGDLPVLLVGETGVGKEELAHALHLSSARREGPFVAVNCAAIPADLLEAEMFGIGRGVATGVAARSGKFQSAEGGTLFLDEIGDMPLLLQVKLLRALQGGEIQPVGGTPVAVNVRIVTATNSDLEERMRDGRLRQDLYYRIAGFVLRVPALRERSSDLAALVDGFLADCARETRKSILGISDPALAALARHAWPGNVRELQHEVRRLGYLCPDGGTVEASMLSERVRAGEEAAPAAEPDTLDLGTNVDVLERRLIGRALARANGSRAGAARLLGISRNGLALKMERLGLENE